MDKLIYKYLQNKLTKEEKLDLQQWLAEDPENLRLFKNFVGHWKLSDFDIELMKYKIWQKIPKAETTHVREGSIYNKYRKILLRVAAVLIIGVGISFYFMDNIVEDDPLVQEQVPVKMEKSAERGQRLTIKLPDGTIVKLNSDSKLLFPDQFSVQRREVTLIGEAFFDVQRDERRPFIIHSGNIRVKVLGTTFNINAYPDQKEVAVAVRSGKVAVSNDSQTMETILSKQEKLVLSGTDGSFRKEFIEDEQMAYGWIDNYLSFNDLNLQEAMELVSKWFDVEYRIYNQEKFSKIITAKFNNPTLKNVMENLSYSYEFKYEINENEIMIK